MKKAILTIMGIILIALVLTSCAQKAKVVQEAPKATEEAPKAPAATTGTEAAQQTPIPATSITKGDLDKLKSDIEGMDIQDIEGIS